MPLRPPRVAHSHLVETLLTLLNEKPASALDAFESVSSGQKAGDGPAAKPVDALTLDAAKKLCELISPTREVGEDGEPIEPEKHDGAAHDLLRDADLLEKAGVGLGKSETLRVVLALKALAEDPEFAVTSVRFFGKIFGTAKDYLVAEVVPSDAGEAVMPSEDELARGAVPMDAPGSGCNKFQYYVCNGAGGIWTKLPDARPDAIMAARQIKKLFTGNLDTPIEGYPVFPGNEADYLRCQIAEIQSCAGIVPKGCYSGPWDEEGYEAPEVGSEDAHADPELTLCADGEEFKRPESLVPLTDANGWVREARPLLARQGRCSWYTAPEAEEEGPAQDLLTPGPAEASPQGLSSLAADAPLAEGVPAWSFRAVYSGLDNSEAAVAKSLVWPGAASVTDLNALAGYYTATVYVGNGAKYEGASFTPPNPPEVQAEAEDPTEEVDVDEPEPEAEPEEGGEE